jgi:hypothetical protein
MAERLENFGDNTSGAKPGPGVHDIGRIMLFEDVGAAS